MANVIGVKVIPFGAKKWPIRILVKMTKNEIIIADCVFIFNVR